MGFLSSVKDWIPVIGKAAIGFLPGGGVATTVLEGIGLLADTIGGDEGTKINKGLEGVVSGLKSIGDKPLSSEDQIQLRDIKSKTEIKMAELALKEKQLPFEDQAGGRDIIKTALQSKDKYVRQSRSRIMTKLGYAAMGFSLFSPIVVLIGVYLHASETMMGMLIQTLTYQGGMIWASFTTSFSGYTVAKYNEKRISKGIPSSRALKTMAKLGQLVS